MTAESNAGKLREIVAGILGVDVGDVTAESGPGTADTWDSLAHLTIVTAVEEFFGVQFAMEEIGRIDTFRALEQALQARLAS
jgi:acyl carrier protein